MLYLKDWLKNTQLFHRNWNGKSWWSNFSTLVSFGFFPPYRRWFTGLYVLSQDSIELRSLNWLKLHRRRSQRLVRLALLSVCSGAHRTTHTGGGPQSQPEHLPGRGPGLAKVKTQKESEMGRGIRTYHYLFHCTCSLDLIPLVFLCSVLTLLSYHDHCSRC